MVASTRSLKVIPVQAAALAPSTVSKAKADAKAPDPKGIKAEVDLRQNVFARSVRRLRPRTTR